MHLSARAASLAAGLVAAGALSLGAVHASTPAVASSAPASTSASAAALPARLAPSFDELARAVADVGDGVLRGEVANARADARRAPVPASELLDAVDRTVAGMRARDQISDQHAADVLAALGDAQDALRHWYRTTAATHANDAR